MNLFIVRHGKTEWNELGLVQGLTDIHVSEKGYEGLKELKKKIDEMDFDICFSSPLIRTRETALFLVGDRVPITIDNRLIERNCGESEGKPIDFDLINKSWDLNIPNPLVGGESAKDVLNRTKEFLDQLKKEDFENVLIVSHGGTIKAMHYNIVGYDENTDLKFYVNNGEIKTYKL